MPRCPLDRRGLDGVPLLDRVGPGTSLENALRVIALTSIPVSIGFAIGAALALRRGGEKAEQIRAGAATCWSPRPERWCSP